MSVNFFKDHSSTLGSIANIVVCALLVTIASSCCPKQEPPATKPVAARKKVSATGPRHVEVTGEPGTFQLLVDGKPYFIKGVGFNVDLLEFAEEELKLARDMGFNSLRFWGKGQTTRAGLDLAEKYGMTVVPSWWTSQDRKDNPTGRNYEDEAQNKAEIAEIVEWVNDLKDHPAVLMWGIGNETYHFGGQGVAYCKFLEQVFQAIHKADPHHPVMTVDVNLTPIWDLAKYTPSLDIYGCNTYSGWIAMKSAPVDLAKVLKKPVVYAEFGPPLPHSTSKVVPKMHAQAYVDAWKKGILPTRGHTLGGYFFVFHDGRPDDPFFGLFDYQNRPKPIITQAVKNALTSNGGQDVVSVGSSPKGFHLLLNGEPYFVKGVSMQTDALTRDAMSQAAEIGLNTVRLSSDAMGKTEFGLMPGYALKAVVRIELEPEIRRKPPTRDQQSAKETWEPTGRDYSNAAQNQAEIDRVVELVSKNKDNQSVLLWEIGNETYSHSTRREEFCKFLNDLCKAVHAADPKHPVAHTIPYTAGIRDLAKYTPDLDIVGVNTYAGPGVVVTAVRDIKAAMNKPSLCMISAFLDEGPTRASLTSEVKQWMDVEMWRRGVLRSRPDVLGGFFRAWRDREDKDSSGHTVKSIWGFVRTDGTPKQENIDSVRSVLLED